MASNAALELKFQSADFNGWQTAYSFDFARRAVPTKPLIGRLEFINATREFSVQIDEVWRHLTTPREHEIMPQLVVLFREFMAADDEIFAAYQSGDPARIAAAHDQVLGEETDRYEKIAHLTDVLVKLIRERTQRSLSAHDQTAALLRQELWGMGALGLVFSAVLTVLLMKSMSKVNALVAELSKQALTDPLTDLPNRRSWNNRIGVELARASRLSYPLAMVMIDFDHFKQFNDQHGHIEGDILLRSAAHAWNQTLREGDLLCRIGGEEFALLLPGCHAADASRLVDRLRPVTPLRQTFSAGIAVWMNDETQVQLFSRADAALYQAKLEGRNRTIIASEIMDQAGAGPHLSGSMLRQTATRPTSS